ncbi:probable 3',5'-cyclic phosphodiesterase pde-5 isoform X2 [Gigantopelta aegis]|uniref:probable 3',5'-cyclic phosphodiesterase pde-5 isoform X2 n=1 Tax=Gigantopelta aegis TaxID=1735272 RepID=UPI001B88B7B2|nr:probable 3',5'-cyclic phosphodiesterase pde-5 isoform X2 [Gigantopelta aegis]
MNEVNSDLVTQFLHQNPEYLDHYVETYVSLDQVERWQIRKSRPPSSYGNRGSSAIGDRLRVNENHHLENKNSLSKWKARIQTSKGRVLHEIAKEIQNPKGKAIILHELAACVSAAVNADGYNLYLVDEGKQEITYSPSSNSGKAFENSAERICLGRTVAAHVACTKEIVRIKDICADSRFPEGLGTGHSKAHAVLGLPLMDGRSNVIGVVEFYKNYKYSLFTDEEEEGAEKILAWGGLALFYAEVHGSMMRQRRLNEFLLTVTKSIFQDIISMDTVIMKIMNFAKSLVHADRASLFLLDTKSRELYARIFDTGTSEDTVLQKEIRFPMDKGVAGHVASTGEILNIQDAYSDDRFNRNVDLQTGYRTKTILCMPIYIRGNVIGVVQMVNKLNGTFSRTDEEAFETFAIYCGLALHHAKLYEKIWKSEQKYKVALEVMSYHCQCSEEELGSVRDSPTDFNVSVVTQYEFSPWGVSYEDKPVFVLHMFKDLFSSMRFDTSDLIRFTLTVRKNYRNVPYHNWVHAFSVAHSMYTVIKTTAHEFTPLESLALFVACLCHDLDHRGKTNAFMVKSASPLAAIYSTSTMEHHHFNQTVTILQQEGHNIFKHLTSEEYKMVLGEIRHSILATDLALFFGNKAKLKDIVDKREFSWKNQEHRELVMAISMTACDLCAMYKPWKTQLDLVNIIMEEFWQQGDEEKSKGMTPMPMMDREKRNELPQLEVGFIIGICLPCYQILADVLLETKPMVDGALANLKKWQEMADENKMIKDKEKPEEDTAADDKVAEETARDDNT